MEMAQLTARLTGDIRYKQRRFGEGDVDYSRRELQVSVHVIRILSE